MDEKEKATEANAQSIAAGEQDKVTVDENLEAKVADLEAQKVKILEEKENYRKAYLKEASKEKDDNSEDDEKLRRIAREELANSQLAEIAREQDAIIKKALKENSELKRVALNKTDTAASVGAHSEGQAVKDTLITSDQLNYFKNTLHWSDKQIEAYKKNLQRQSGR